MINTKPKIGIIDLESNNLYSIYNSCLISGFKARIINPKEKKFNYNLIIIPGVGAFKTGMKILKKYGYNSKIYDYLNKQNSLVYGICLGMQILFSTSQEFGLCKGLDLISGKVKKFSKLDGIKTNMGWSKVFMGTNDSIFDKKKFNNQYFYFVHSLHASPSNNKDVFGVSYHNKKKFASVVKKNNIIGTQFHPEKSGEIGVAFLKNLKKVI